MYLQRQIRHRLEVSVHPEDSSAEAAAVVAAVDGDGLLAAGVVLPYAGCRRLRKVSASWGVRRRRGDATCR